MMNFSLTYTKGFSNYTEARKILEEVQKWYSRNLGMNSSAAAYIKSRGATQQSIEQFGIGYVGNSNELIEFLSTNFLPLPQAVEAGVVAESDRGGGLYARLTERITFPIYSPSGAIVGFGGRTISNHPAKYINSPQTKLFNKSQLLYGYNVAKEHIYHRKQMIVCEGYLDVIMFHQAGFKESVATLGTALTEGHLSTLRKGEPKIILAYDGDKAGIAAALKAAKLLSAESFDGSVVLFPNGADPADMIAKGKVNEVKELLNQKRPLIPFVLEMIANEYDLSKHNEKSQAFELISNYLHTLSPIMREIFIPVSASILGVSTSIFAKGNPLPSKVCMDEGKEDYAILSIIKTLYDKQELVEEVSSAITPAMFENYSSLLEVVIYKEDEKKSLLTRLLIEDSIKVMEEDEFKKAIILFLMVYYEKRRKQIMKDSSRSINERMFLNRIIRHNILHKLKLGQIVPFSSL